MNVILCTTGISKTFNYQKMRLSHRQNVMEKRFRKTKPKKREDQKSIDKVSNLRPDENQNILL
jgi:hypothetical protein